MAEKKTIGRAREKARRGKALRARVGGLVRVSGSGKAGVKKKAATMPARAAAMPSRRSRAQVRVWQRELRSAASRPSLSEMAGFPVRKRARVASRVAASKSSRAKRKPALKSVARKSARTRARK